MKRSDMVEHLASALDIPKKAAGQAITEITGLIAAELKSQGRASISDLGTFTVRARAARKGRNPKTGEPLKIKASKRVAFRASPAIKEAANKHRLPKA